MHFSPIWPNDQFGFNTIYCKYRTNILNFQTIFLKILYYIFSFTYYWHK